MCLTRDGQMISSPGMSGTYIPQYVIRLSHRHPIAYSKTPYRSPVADLPKGCRVAIAYIVGLTIAWFRGSLALVLASQSHVAKVTLVPSSFVALGVASQSHRPHIGPYTRTYLHRVSLTVPIFCLVISLTRLEYVFLLFPSRT